MSDHQATPLVNIPDCRVDSGTRLITATGTLTIDGETFWQVLNLERRMSGGRVGWLDPVPVNFEASSWGVVELLKSFGFGHVYCHDQWVHIDDEWTQHKYSSAAPSIWLAIAASVDADTEALFVFENCGDFWGEMITQNRYTRVTYELHPVKAVTL
jgi:hypothetical protein